MHRTHSKHSGNKWSMPALSALLHQSRNLATRSAGAHHRRHYGSRFVKVWNLPVVNCGDCFCVTDDDEDDDDSEYHDLGWSAAPYVEYLYPRACARIAMRSTIVFWDQKVGKRFWWLQVRKDEDGAGSSPINCYSILWSNSEFTLRLLTIFFRFTSFLALLLLTIFCRFTSFFALFYWQYSSDLLGFYSPFIYKVL